MGGRRRSSARRVRRPRRARRRSGWSNSAGQARSRPVKPRATRATTPGGQQRVAAEVEEVVVRRRPLQAEQVGPDPGEEFLGRGAGAGDVPPSRRVVGCGQGRAVDLAVGGERERGQLDEHRRDHVVRQVAAGEGAAQLVGGGRRRRSGRRGPGSAIRPLSVLDGRPRPCLHAGWAGQRGLDLAGLDAEAADLDLVVDAAEELELPVGRASGPGRRCGTAAAVP